MIEMRLDNIIRSFMIASLILLIAVLIEAAYFGLNQKNTYYIDDTAYSVAAPFVNNFSSISSPTNTIILVILFVISFVMISNMISKRERS
jgi:hypothetical protein